MCQRSIGVAHRVRRRDPRARRSAERRDLSRSVGKALEANKATFPSPPIPGAALAAAADAVTSAEAAAKAARQASLLATSKRDDALAALDSALGLSADYVQLAAKGDGSIIALSTLAVRGAPVRATAAPSAPDPLAALTGAKAAEAKLTWGKSAGAKGFIVESTANPVDPASWKHVMSTATSKRSVVATGQPSGRLWYRVAALGTQGRGPWSDPATCIVG
ncbi:MAG: fibronectin type III domain-containing protein [Polyangiaceae bacterium]